MCSPSFFFFSFFLLKKSRCHRTILRECGCMWTERSDCFSYILFMMLFQYFLYCLLLVSMLKRFLFSLQALTFPSALYHILIFPLRKWAFLFVVQIHSFIRFFSVRFLFFLSFVSFISKAYICIRFVRKIVSSLMPSKWEASLKLHRNEFSLSLSLSHSCLLLLSVVLCHSTPANPAFVSWARVRTFYVFLTYAKHFCTN